MVEEPKKEAAMRSFTTVWVGQFVSLLGTGMTNFAISLWLYEQTGSATTLTTLFFFSYSPAF